MLRLVLREMGHHAERTAFAMLAIGAAVSLVLVIEGFQQGLLEQMRRVVLARGGDLIVTQAGVENFLASRSVIPQLSRSRIEPVPGVAAVHPLVLVPIIYERHGRKSPIFLLVYDTAGGPGTVVQGMPISRPREVVVDEALARMHGLKVGDPLVISDFEFRISGITRGAAAMFTPFVFVKYDDLIDFYFESDMVGDIMTLPLVAFFLVDVAPDFDPAEVAAGIERADPAIDVFRPQALARRDATLGETLFGPVMQALLAVSYVICLLLIGIIMFAVIHRRARTLGVLKVLGFANRTLVLAAVTESVLLTVLALPVAWGLAWLTAAVIESIAPLYLLVVSEPGILVRAGAVTLVLAAFGALGPARFIGRLEPALAARV